MIQSIARLLYGVLTAQVKATFHKINVHAAMTPSDIWEEFRPVFHQAKVLREAFEKNAMNIQEQAKAAPVKRQDSSIKKSFTTLMSVSSSSSVESMADDLSSTQRMPFVTVSLLVQSV